ncbi:hypothetical protein [Psychrobacter sp. I-STPA10]|uniref:hypothetical protein n=1 Tax=Psychrobacter sp. I-STPA10 TaxID=2585769 RepID=UPI001E60EBE1|nr:hypothetical protein [Psychrobacter sp. I-STPA10]
MAETTNTAQLANKVSSEIFEFLKWKTHFAKDFNFDCNNPNHKKTEHPCDVVFYYKNPYTDKTIYLNTDLKSYKKSSINSNKVRSALKSLAMSIECAFVSEKWQEQFTNDCDFDIYGLLFIYNYDGSFSQNSEKNILNNIATDKLGITKNHPIAVFDPITVQYLLNVIDDLKDQLRERKLLDHTAYNFYYPNLVTAKTHRLDSYPATIEMILSPFMIVQFKGNLYNNFVVYYQELGASPEEFIYLIDTLANHQILSSDNIIQVVLNKVNGNNCIAHFNTAKRTYAELYGMEVDGDIFSNLIVKTLIKKYQYYDPLDERITDEQN